MWPSLEQTLILFTWWGFVPSLVEIYLVVLKNKMKMWKVYNDSANANANRTTMTDNGQILIIKAHLSCQLRRAKIKSACTWLHWFNFFFIYSTSSISQQYNLWAFVAIGVPNIPTCKASKTDSYHWKRDIIHKRSTHLLMLYNYNQYLILKRIKICTW